MTGWEIYWLTRLDVFRVVLKVPAIIALVLGVILAVVYVFSVVSDETEKEKRATTIGGRVTLFLLTVASIFGLAVAATPTSKEMAAILVIPKIVNNEQVKELPENVIGLANEWIKAKSEQLTTNKAD